MSGHRTLSNLVCLILIFTCPMATSVAQAPTFVEGSDSSHSENRREPCLEYENCWEVTEPEQPEIVTCYEVGGCDPTYDRCLYERDGDCGMPHQPPAEEPIDCPEINCSEPQTEPCDRLGDCDLSDGIAPVEPTLCYGINCFEPRTERCRAWEDCEGRDDPTPSEISRDFN